MYSGNPKEAKVGAILNWLRDNANEIYSNFNWATPADKDDPDKVLDEFEKYFEPAHNKYHSWYTWVLFIQVNLRVSLNSW